MMVNRKVVFFGGLALLFAGAMVGRHISPIAGTVLIALGGVLLWGIMLGGKGGTL